MLDAALDPAAAAVEIDNPATAAVEYVGVGALSDADGFYGLDGIGGAFETIDLRGGRPLSPGRSAVSTDLIRAAYQRREPELAP